MIPAPRTQTEVATEQLGVAVIVGMDITGADTKEIEICHFPKYRRDLGKCQTLRTVHLKKQYSYYRKLMMFQVGRAVARCGSEQKRKKNAEPNAKRDLRRVQINLGVLRN